MLNWICLGNFGVSGDRLHFAIGWKAAMITWQDICNVSPCMSITGICEGKSNAHIHPSHHFLTCVWQVLALRDPNLGV